MRDKKGIVLLLCLSPFIVLVLYISLGGWINVYDLPRVGLVLSPFILGGLAVWKKWTMTRDKKWIVLWLSLSPFIIIALFIFFTQYTRGEDWVIIGLVFAPLMLVVLVAWRTWTLRLPKVEEHDIKIFQDRLPEGFGYPYYLDNTGYGINVEEDKIILVNGSSYKIYDRRAIRQIQSTEASWTEYTGGRGWEAVGASLTSAENRRNAFNDSGIFINVTDIDHPQWQIKVSDTYNRNRCYEILQQFLNRQLKPYSEYLKEHR